MPSRSEQASVRRVILALFFLSGACGLVYEVVWMRMLTLVFGVTAFASSTILASFFAGLALGGFYFGRVVDKGTNPLLIYASLEAGIGLFGFLMPLLFLGVTALYVAVAQRFGLSYYQISLLRFVLCFTVLVIPATLMGGTLPVMVKFFAGRPERLGWSGRSPRIRCGVLSGPDDDLEVSPGLRKTSQLFEDVEALLILRLDPPGNIRNTFSRGIVRHPRERIALNPDVARRCEPRMSYPAADVT